MVEAHSVSFLRRMNITQESVSIGDQVRIAGWPGIGGGADIFVTSDFKYHEFFGAEGRLLIADVGHYESEWQTTHLIVSRLNNKFTNFAVHLAEANPNPIHYR